MIALSGNRRPSNARPDRVRGAAKRVAPQLTQARAWVAPRVERGGLAVQDTIAPRIAGLLSTAAHKLDPAQPQPQRHRRWPRALAGTIMVAAAAGVAVTVVRRRRRRANDLADDDLAYAGPDHADSGNGRAEPSDRASAADPEQAKVNGQLQHS